MSSSHTPPSHRRPANAVTAKKASSGSRNEETLASEVIAASLGGAISASILYPLEVLKTNMQGDTDPENENDGMLTYARKLYNRQGLGVFLRGFETSAFQSATEKALYFFAYTSLKHSYQKSTATQSMGTLTNLIIGCAAEWAHLPISLPIDLWTTRIQTTNQAPMAILLSMLQEPNKRACWYKGLSAYTLLCLKPALQYTVFEQVKAWLVQNRRNPVLQASEAFVLGMVARTIATVLVFPFLRAKVLLQTAKKKKQISSSNNNDEGNEGSSSSSSDDNSDTTVAQVLSQIYNRDGLGGVFQGLGPELTRGIFSAALMLMLKEQVAVRVRQAIAAQRSPTA